MGYVIGVNLLPSTGEFTYDTIPYLGRRVTEPALTSINRYASGGPLAGAGSTTDYTIAINNLQAEFPGCTTVALVVAWFGNSTDIAACQIYPSTTYIGGTFRRRRAGRIMWRCSGLTQNSPGLIPIPQSGGAFIYGGTPSDQSIVRCIRDLKARGLRVVFYPFILMTAAGQPWRGRIAYNGSDISSAATTAVNNFLGGATASDFTRDSDNLTVAYAGAPTDYTYRRMILHYANLCVVAGGVDLFLLGSELRGIETIRGPGWTQAGTTVSGGTVTWDYPFVAGLVQLPTMCAACSTRAGLTKDTVNLHNLISYSADWSVWMGLSASGRKRSVAASRPALRPRQYRSGLVRQLSAAVGLDDGRRRARCAQLARRRRRPAPGRRPRRRSTVSACPASRRFTVLTYLKANIEGGQNFNWFYNDSNNAGIGLDPDGTDLRVSLPQGDRLAQQRNAYDAGQELLAEQTASLVVEQSASGGLCDRERTWVPQGAFTEWVPQSKPIIFAEYGFPACDRGTNQPNVFYDPPSTESFDALLVDLGSDASTAGGYAPRRDDNLHLLALQAIYEYWVTDGNNETSAARADDRDRVHVGLELGRAAVSDIPAARRCLGRHRQLAVRRLARRQGAVRTGAAA